MEKDKPYIGNVLTNPKYKQQPDSAEITGADTSVRESAAHNDRLTRFNASQGHGYAAEQANDLIDKLHGRDAKILGDDNAKNGADRMVDGQLIQTKYCQSARESVNAAFTDNGNGSFRYLDANGNPMQIEVPSDQYEEALEVMRKRIAEGKVPGVSDPKDAEKLVRKGNIDYQTAKNIAKAGNIDSLAFDAAHGAVIAASALGISGVITFARSMWSGKPLTEALDDALYVGLQTGGIVFISSVLSAQLTRTGLNKALIPLSTKIVKALPSEVREALVTAMRGAPLYGAEVTKNLAKLLRSNVISGVVVTVVLSAGDIGRFFSGKISGPQLFKNVTKVAGTMGGAGLGAVIGSGIPFLGTTIGGIAGSLVGGVLSGKGLSKVLDALIEDDIVMLVKILDKRFTVLAQEYLLDEDEVNLVLDDLQLALTPDVLGTMYASHDRKAFTDGLLRQLIEKRIALRARIILPPAAVMAAQLSQLLAGKTPASSLPAAGETKKHQLSTGQKMAELLDLDVSKHAADAAWHATKQSNACGVSSELQLQTMKNDETVFIQQQQQQQKKHAQLMQKFQKYHSNLENDGNTIDEFFKE